MLEKSIGFYIGALHRGAHKYFERYLRPIGVHRGMLRILMELNEKEQVSQKALNDSLETDKANTARLLQKMEEQGLLRRVIDGDDRRNRLVQLRADGRELIEPAENVLKRWIDILTEGMTEPEKACYLTLLERSFRNINDYFEAVDE